MKLLNIEIYVNRMGNISLKQEDAAGENFIEITPDMITIVTKTIDGLERKSRECIAALENEEQA